MKTNQTIQYVAGAILLAGLSISASAQELKSWKEIKKPTLREFKIQQPVRIQLSNGMVIFLQEDRELPLVRGFMSVRGGSREEAADKVGLAQIYGQTWRTGGTKTRTGDQLDEFLELRGARIESSADVDSSSLSFDTLKGDLDPVFQAFTDLLMNPEFREEKLTLAKTQLNTGISRRNDDASAIAGRESSRIGYGRDSVYARITEYSTVAAVTREDLVSWHKRFAHPNNMLLGVIGDFDAKAMEARLRAAFEKLPRGPQAATPEVAFTDPKPGVYFVNKDDVNQSNIRMVHMGVRRDNPDYFALQVFNEALGGGFSARLFSNIRSKKGLAYSVGGGVGAEYDHPGLVRLSMGTKSESTAAAIEALYSEVDDLSRLPFTAEELQRSKESILNSFIFRYDSKDKILLERLALEFYGYPSDFIERYRSSVDKVTTADVARVAKKYVGRDKFAVIVVGKEKDFDKPLSTFGTVTRLDITIPEGTAAKPSSAPAGSNAEGKALIARVVDGFGGKAKLQSVKSLRRVGAAQMKTPQGEMAMEMDVVEMYPDRVIRKMKMAMGEVTMIVAPEASFMAMGAMGVRDLPGSQKDAILKEMKRDVLFVARNADDAAYSFALAGSEKINGVDTKILVVSNDGSDQRWFVDPASGRVLRTVRSSVEQGSPVESITDYSDFKTFDGITVSTKQVIQRNGEKVGDAQLTDVKVNPTVDMKSFEKPAAPAN